jgi:D-inositol-3-phosphate glycosyltransferase
MKDEKVLKVYVKAPAGLSRAMTRVADALQEHVGPGFVVVDDANDADVVVLHVIGYPETVERVEQLTAAGKKYAIMQYCMRSTQEPSTLKWLSLWRGAVAVWSYYHLEAMWKDDIGSTALQIEPQQFGVNFYHAPLGADPSVFKPFPAVPRKPDHAIVTTGYIAETEGVWECEEATQALGLKMFHLGPNLGFKAHVRHREGINDAILAQVYSQYNFVAGLRRVEGFELPAVEGLFCGARPIMFDAPHYRRWFEGLAEFVPEDSHDQVVSSLVNTFLQDPQTTFVTPENIAEAHRRFDWANLVPGFWQKVHAAVYPPLVTEPLPRVEVHSKPLLVFCGDAVVSSGFAKSTHKLCDVLDKYYEVHVLGINYFGDPHPYPYKIWSCRTLNPRTKDDAFGIARIPELMHKLRPSVVLVQNDWWNFKPYLQAVGNTPVIGIVAVDGKNCSKAKEMNGLKHAIFWTEFGRQEAHKGGYQGPSSVVPLGVDLEVFKPQTISKAELRYRAGWPPEAYDAFVVGCVNRNQLRKRMDLVVTRFVEWVREYSVNDAYLFVHTSPTGDVGFDVSQGMDHYGLSNRLIYSQPEPGFGAPERALRNLYCSFDVLFTQTQGEGFGLPHIEAAACGVPSVVPQWAALAEWPGDAFYQVPCTDTAWTIGGPNTIGGIADPRATVDALQQLYKNRAFLQVFSERSLALAQEPRFRWEAIGEQVADIVKTTLDQRPIEVVDKVFRGDQQREVQLT